MNGLRLILVESNIINLSRLSKGDLQDKMDYNFPSNGDSEIPLEIACLRKMKGWIMVIEVRRGFLMKGGLFPRLVEHLYIDQINHHHKKDIREYT